MQQLLAEQGRTLTDTRTSPHVVINNAAMSGKDGKDQAVVVSTFITDSQRPYHVQQMFSLTGGVPAANRAKRIGAKAFKYLTGQLARQLAVDDLSPVKEVLWGTWFEKPRQPRINAAP